MRRLQAKGWTVYHEYVPLQGQSGYRCIREVPSADGSFVEQCHSVRWNVFQYQLVPCVLECEHEIDLLNFLWRHAAHASFKMFDFGEGDVGFVCHCRADRGYSLALNVSPETAAGMNESARVVLDWYA